VADEAFSIDKRPLRDLLQQVEVGKAQLPEFQRGWVWPWPNIVGLLASISLSYPVGTVMLLRSGGDLRFKYRPVEGASPIGEPEPESLILDGQQRLTSLFQALKLNRPVVTHDLRRQQVTGWFYVDMLKALEDNGDREEAIRFIPESRRVVNFRGDVLEDYSRPQLEYQHHLYPLNAVFDSGDWGDEFTDHWSGDREKRLLWRRFRQDFVRPFDLYHVPVIELGQATPRQAVCQVFEKVNTGGVTLTVFELLTATYAAEEFDLRKHWEECRAAWKSPEYRILREVSNTDFLQAVTLLATAERHRLEKEQGTEEDRLPRIGCKRKDMLALSLEDYRRFAPVVVDGFRTAAKFLRRQYLFDTKFLPYGTQLIPLAAILALAGPAAQSAGAQQKLARWYWCGVFGELYGGSTETRLSQDLPDVVEWIHGSPVEPRTVVAAQFSPGRFLTLRTRISAAYKGIYALLLKAGAVDWRTGEKAEVNQYFDESIDIHHVFPRTWCEKAGLEPAVFNSILNKTPLTARTNRIIGGSAPSSYLVRLEKSAETDADGVARHIRTHLIDPSMMAKDNFEGFLADRKAALLSQISAAMGKAIADEDWTQDAQNPSLEALDDTDDM
jgi:hypothetical protein